VKIRVDIWLHRARLFKSRTQATTGLPRGKILISDKFADAGDGVSEGDTVKIRMRGHLSRVSGEGSGDVNLSKQDAKRMYKRSLRRMH